MQISLFSYDMSVEAIEMRFFLGGGVQIPSKMRDNARVWDRNYIYYEDIILKLFKWNKSEH